jgi:hyperosmotically inducible periplasmic protein
MTLARLILVALLVTACDRALPRPETSAPASVARVERPPPSPPAETPAPPGSAARTPAPPPEALTDAAITGRIRSELRADPGMAGADVSVNTDRGVVVLSGTVKSQEQTGIASAHAQRQDGVMRVDNQLRPALS